MLPLRSWAIEKLEKVFSSKQRLSVDVSALVYATVTYTI